MLTKKYVIKIEILNNLHCIRIAEKFILIIYFKIKISEVDK